jgi:alpha-methylacyl-CoA racemase
LTDVRPLDGVRVLDLTRLLPGAYATLLLADLGAEVIKIEDPRGGDTMRSLPTAGSRNYFELLNRGKRSVTLDLRSPEAATVLDALCAKADVVIDSFRPSTARRLGVGIDTLRQRHPHLVCASITGFGQTGPYAERAAHDINYQALAGLLVQAAGGVLSQSSVAGLNQSSGAGPRQPPVSDASVSHSTVSGPSQPPGSSQQLETDSGLRLETVHAPRLPGPLVGDIGAATEAAIRILAALLLRARTGTGSIVDVSIHEAALAWAMFPTTGELANACYTLYETADGQWLALGALEPKFWTGFCEGIRRPDLVPLQHARGDERTWVESEVRRVMLGLTRDEWLTRFAGVEVCLTPVYTPEEVAADPHLTARSQPDKPSVPAPALGGDTDAVLDAAGIAGPERARLRGAGVI